MLTGEEENVYLEEELLKEYNIDVIEMFIFCLSCFWNEVQINFYWIVKFKRRKTLKETA